MHDAIIDAAAGLAMTKQTHIGSASRLSADISLTHASSIATKSCSSSSFVSFSARVAPFFSSFPP